MKSDQILPDQERFSTVVATILLGYAIVQFVNVPLQTLPIEVLGIYIPISINFNTIIAFALAGMTASGTDWLLRDHPSIEGKSSFPHLLLPALTAWIINVILGSYPNTPMWWLIFLTGGGFLLVVILAEFIAVDAEDIRHPLAIALLNALSLALFLGLAVSLRSTSQRLVMVLPATAISTTGLSLRILRLKYSKKWLFPHALTCMAVTAQLAAALHYLPISPLSFGLFLLGGLYATISLIQNIIQEPFNSRMITEPIVVLVVLWSIAIWIN